MKKNVLAVALVAGLGLAGAAAAYNYGTNLSDDLGAPVNSNAALQDAENVSYEMLVATDYNWIMQEGIVFDIETADNAAAVTEGFTVRIALNQRCNPHNGPTNPASPPTNVGVCAATTDGAKFDATYDINANAATDLILDPALVGQWQVTFDGFTNNDTVATFRIEPLVPNPTGPGTNGTTITFTWNNAHLTSLNEFAAAAYNSADGTGGKVDAEFWMVNVSNDARFVNSTWSRTILESRRAVEACANPEGSDVDSYIDVADNYAEVQKPKTRFSWDGRLGSAVDSAGGTLQAPADAGSQVINLGQVTLGDASEPTFNFWGATNAFNGEADRFRTVIDAGAGNDWNAFDNIGSENDDVYLVDGTCASGTIVDQGIVSGSAVTFLYDADEAGMITDLVNHTGTGSKSLTVCGFVDSDTIIDDHNNHVTTTFYRVGMYPANSNFAGDPLAAQPTDSTVGNITGSKVYSDPGPDGHCDLLPLRYNGSTMEIFTINPGSNTTQRSFIRLTNRSATDGFVSLEGIDNAGVRGASQVRVWVPAGASMQLDAADLENGTNGAVGAWGAPTNGKWRAIVTAEFPGLVATSLVNSALPRVLSNITDSDTRGEQIDRDFAEGTWGSEVGQRPSDFVQEVEPDFRGNGDFHGEPGGPDADDGPAGGTTDECGNPGMDGTLPTNCTWQP